VWLPALCYCLVVPTFPPTFVPRCYIRAVDCCSRCVAVAPLRCVVVLTIAVRVTAALPLLFIVGFTLRLPLRLPLLPVATRAYLPHCAVALTPLLFVVCCIAFSCVRCRTLPIALPRCCGLPVCCSRVVLLIVRCVTFRFVTTRCGCTTLYVHVALYVVGLPFALRLLLRCVTLVTRYLRSAFIVVGSAVAIPMPRCGYVRAVRVPLRCRILRCVTLPRLLPSRSDCRYCCWPCRFVTRVIAVVVYTPLIYHTRYIYVYPLRYLLLRYRCVTGYGSVTVVILLRTLWLPFSRVAGFAFTFDYVPFWLMRLRFVTRCCYVRLLHTYVTFVVAPYVCCSLLFAFTRFPCRCYVTQRFYYYTRSRCYVYTYLVRVVDLRWLLPRLPALLLPIALRRIVTFVAFTFTFAACRVAAGAVTFTHRVARVVYAFLTTPCRYPVTALLRLRCCC